MSESSGDGEALNDEALNDDASPFDPAHASVDSAAISPPEGDVQIAEVIEAPPVRYRRPPQQQRMGVAFHSALLALALVVLAASFILNVDQGAVEAPIAGIPLPGLCTFKRLTGADCPGCGLTRCFVSISHGRLQEAWSFNPSGIFLYLMMLFQIPYRATQIYRIKAGLPEIDLGVVGGGFMVIAAGAMLLQWALRTSYWL